MLKAKMSLTKPRCAGTGAFPMNSGSDWNRLFHRRRSNPTRSAVTVSASQTAKRWTASSSFCEQVEVLLGGQWNALSATGICSSSVAHSRFQEWCKAGVFEKLWAQGLAEYDKLVGIDWQWLSLDGSITKAPGVARGEAERQAGKRGHKTRPSGPAQWIEAKQEPSVAS